MKKIDDFAMSKFRYPYPYRKFRHIGISEDFIWIYRHWFQYRYFRYIENPQAELENSRATFKIQGQPWLETAFVIIQANMEKVY